MKKSLATLFSLSVIATNVMAMQIDSTPVTANALITKPSIAQTVQPLQKKVYLMNIKLTPEQKNKLTTIRTPNKLMAFSQSNLPSKVELGMNNVPVLDQGRHGTCVTFAVSGALDAIMKRGDYVSQLCSLELGSTLENVGYTPGGWDGSLGNLVIDQYLEFGIVDVATQKAKTCGGMTNYPTNDENQKGSAMALDEYHALSQNINETVYASPIMNMFDRLNWDRSHVEANVEHAFTKVKEALATKVDNGETRVVFGVMLPLIQECPVGACGKHNAEADSWVLSKEIINGGDDIQFGGHEMIITGYDDNAVAIDKEGNKHKGLFTLRNSWGKEAGDSGNYYMSYDFFKQFAIEANQLVYNPDNNAKL